MATHSSILAWRIPWTEATVHGEAKSWTRTEQLTQTHMISCNPHGSCEKKKRIYISIFHKRKLRTGGVGMIGLLCWRREKFKRRKGNLRRWEFHCHSSHSRRFQNVQENYGFLVSGLAIQSNFPLKDLVGSAPSLPLFLPPTPFLT